METKFLQIEEHHSNVDYPTHLHESEAWAESEWFREWLRLARLERDGEAEGAGEALKAA